MAEMVIRNRRARGEKCNAGKLTADSVRDILKRLETCAIYKRGLYAALARDFGVDPALIRRIHLKEAWKHVA